MSKQGEWHKVLHERRLPHQLEIQSRRIEKVLSKHDVPARVEGGYVQPRSIRFDLASHLETGLERLRQIKQELLTAVGAADGELVPHNGGWQLHVARPDEPPVSLLDLLALVPDVPPLTIVLGLDEDGRPVLVELSEQELTHILITGEKGAGKTSLLRTIALSLALTHKQSQLQLAVIDGSSGGEFEAYTALEPLTYLPHMLASVVYGSEEYVELVNFLAGECAYRQEQQMNTPKIVVLMDEATRLFRQTAEQAKAFEGITQLLQRGPAVGIHLILTTDEPQSERLSNTLRLNLPVRLVGKVADEGQAVAAADMSGTQAEYLLGQGDFLAVVDRQMTHFQAAFIGDYDLHLTLETLHRARPQPLLAHPVSIQNLGITAGEKPEANTLPFMMKDTGVEIFDLDSEMDDDMEGD